MKKEKKKRAENLFYINPVLSKWVLKNILIDEEKTGDNRIVFSPDGYKKFHGANRERIIFKVNWNKPQTDAYNQKEAAETFWTSVNMALHNLISLVSFSLPVFHLYTPWNLFKSSALLYRIVHGILSMLHIF